MRASGFHPRLVCLAAAVAALFAVWLLAGCDSGTATMPHLKTRVTFGPKPGQATIYVTPSGAGSAFSGIVLTYPDGHRRMLGTATYELLNGGTWEVDHLASGVYTYTVYATPAGPAGTGPFPVGEIVKENAVASGRFTIP